MPQINGNTYEALSGPSEITIEGVKYDVRTRVVYDNKGRTGTIDTDKPLQYEFQYRQKPDIGNPVPSWTPLATRSEDKSKNNGWVFTQAAGPGFKKSLVEKGPNTLTSSMDNAAQNALAKDANVPVARAQESLKVSPNKALPTVAADQNPNAAAGGPNENQASDEGSLSVEDDKKISEDKETEFDGTRSKFKTDLRFPLNFKSDYQDTISFSMVKYRPRKLETTGNSLNPIQNRQEAKDILGRVFLPIPSGISDTKSVDWASSNLDPFKAIGADIAQTSIVKGIGAGVKQIGNAATAVSNNSGDAGTATANFFVEAATGAENLLSRTQGLIINPNMELLFTGPQLRQFGFTFKLSARSQQESQAILNIIRFFKQGMSPIRTKSQLFLKAPYTFQIQYLHRGKQHRYLNKIKECALQSFNVEYTPEGQYATFTSGAMVSYQITMQFSELEPIFNDEYGAGGGNTQNDSEIGY